MLEIKKKSIQLCCVRGMSEFGCRGFIHSMKKKGRRGGEVKKVDNEIIVSPPKRTTESDPHRGKIGGVKKEKPMHADDDDDNTTNYNNSYGGYGSSIQP